MAGGDGAAVLVDAGVVVGDAEVLEEGQHLHGEGLVELEQPDVLDASGRRTWRSAFSVAGTGPMPMTSGLTPTTSASGQAESWAAGKAATRDEVVETVDALLL